jgi:hypothetical protein
MRADVRTRASFYHTTEHVAEAASAIPDRVPSAPDIVLRRVAILKTSAQTVAISPNQPENHFENARKAEKPY